MKITFQPSGREVQPPPGATVLEAMRLAGLTPDAPCGGSGTCGKCGVYVDGVRRLACQTPVRPGMTVHVPAAGGHVIQETGVGGEVALDPLRPEARFHAAVDIGTTTIVCHLLDGRTGAVLATAGALNPQRAFGADVISRIRAALDRNMEALTAAVRGALSALLEGLCREAGAAPEELGAVAVVGNPCMQQLFLGRSPANLASPPFAPVLTRREVLPAGDYIAAAPEASLLIAPDIAGYIGADTVGCILAAGLHQSDRLTLVVDIGTNGEMVLGSRHGMTACAAAAGPALEGASISCGMRGAAGAVDRVWLEEEGVRFSVIGGGAPEGICGSGLIDLAAVLLESGAIDRRGRLRTAEQCPRMAPHLTEDGTGRCFTLCGGVRLTQEDIREVQLAKGAIAAGIELMARSLDVALEEIDRVLLAGAFGSFIRKESACAIGLLPPELLDRIETVGNAAASGSRMIALSREAFRQSEDLCRQVRGLHLESVPGFSRCFARHTWF